MNSAKGRGFNSSRLVAGCCAGVVGLAPGWRRHHGIVASPGELSVLETKGAVAPNRAVARPRAPRSGANGAAQRR